MDSRLELFDHMKDPEMCIMNDGIIYIAFCRMERTDRHGEAVEFINTEHLVEKILAKINNIESGAAQLSTKTLVDDNNKPIWYHTEKAKFLQVSNQALKSQERLIARMEMSQRKGRQPKMNLKKQRIPSFILRTL